MGNSIYNDYSMNNMANLLNQFNQFRSTFQGNPQAQIQQLLQSGRMSQSQFTQLAEQATQIRKLLK